MTGDGKVGPNPDTRDNIVLPSDASLSTRDVRPHGIAEGSTISNGDQDDATKKSRIAIDRWVELAFTFAISVATAVNVYVAHSQWSAMVQNNSIVKGQLDAMEIDKRPWIRANVDIKELRLVEWGGDKHINTALIFDLKNYGELPAINIVISTNVASHPGNSERTKLDIAQKVICEQARAQAVANPIGGPTIFPTDSNSIQSGAGSSGIYKTGKPTIFSVNGCIDYSYGKDRHGQTGFRMIIGKIAGNKVVGIPFVEGVPHPYDEPISSELLINGYPADPPKVAIIPRDDFLLRLDEGGNYAK